VRALDACPDGVGSVGRRGMHPGIVDPCESSGQNCRRNTLCSLRHGLRRSRTRRSAETASSQKK
jgi:hypothetical protein